MRMYYNDASFSFTNESASLATEGETKDNLSCSVSAI